MTTKRMGGTVRPTDYTAADDAKLREQFASGVIVKHIAESLGRTMDSIYRRAWRLGLSRPISKVRPPVMSNAILEAAAKPGGYHHSIDLGYPRAQVTTRCVVLCNRGLLFRANLGYKQMRYFSTPEAAAAALAAPVPTQIKKAPDVTIALRRGPAHLPGDPLITPHTKFTIAPPPPACVYRTNTFQ